MVERTFDFDAEYSDALIEDAARTFVHRLFRKYLWLLVAACLMNIIGFAAVVALLRTIDWMTVTIGVIAVVGPVYFPWQYYRLPVELAAPMKRTLVPGARVSVTPSSFTLSAKGHTFTRRWTDLKSIVECPEYFLFVVGPLAFTFVPRRHMPLEAQQMVREATATLVQPNLSMQPTGQQRPAAD